MSVIEMKTPEQISQAPVACAECGHEAQALPKHLLTAHKMTVADYQAKHPGQPIMSEAAKRMLEERRRQKEEESKAVAANSVATQPVLARPWKKNKVSMLATLGIGVGAKADRDREIPYYSGFTDLDGVPAIDPHYRFPYAMRYMAVALTIEDGKVYAHGPTGCGKTVCFEQFAARTGRPFARIQISPQMEPADIYGNYIVDGSGRLVFHHALFAVAMQLPSIICLDEFDSGNPVILAMLNAVLEGKPLVIPQTGERIVKHPDCRIVATGNTAGMGDDTGLYNSTSVMSFATMNRWSMVIEMGYLDAAEEADMLKQRLPNVPPAIVDKVVQYANDVRKAFINKECSVVLSTRQLIHWLMWFGYTAESVETYLMAFGNMLGGSDREFCDNLFQRVFGDKVERDMRKRIAAAKRSSGSSATAAASARAA